MTKVHLPPGRVVGFCSGLSCVDLSQGRNRTVLEPSTSVGAVPRLRRRRPHREDLSEERLVMRFARQDRRYRPAPGPWARPSARVPSGHDPSVPVRSVSWWRRLTIELRARRAVPQLLLSVSAPPVRVHVVSRGSVAVFRTRSQRWRCLGAARPARPRRSPPGRGPGCHGPVVHRVGRVPRSDGTGQRRQARGGPFTAQPERSARRAVLCSHRHRCARAAVPAPDPCPMSSS